MTYCVALLLDQGMVFASDSRTNAGVDQISSFRKMKILDRADDRLVVILSSGNLSITQNAINLLEMQARQADGALSIWNAQSMFEVVTLIGESLRQVRQRDASYLSQANVDSSAAFIVGGQLKGEQQRLFLVYSEGNFIEAGTDTPFFQIGETKYGRPIIDRVIKPNTTLVEATKCVLVSFDSTMRSNISVGMPIDLVVSARDSFKLSVQKRLQEDDPYFAMIHAQWGEGLRRVFAQLPDPSWKFPG
jgi:putative proteasome-type protease